MPRPIHLKQILIEALNRNNETIDDIIASSIPIRLMDEMTTLEEIQCYYLWEQSEKQHLPLVAFTKKYIYFHHNEGGNPTEIMIYSNKNGVDFIAGVESYPIEDTHDFSEYRIQHMKEKKKDGQL